MVLLHFWKPDLAGTLLAVCVFALVALVPGYVVSRSANLFDFKSLPFGWKFAVSVPVSIGICPIVVYWLDRLGGWTAVWAGFGICWLAFTVLLAVDLKSALKNTGVQRPPKIFFAFAALLIVWIALAVGSALDLQFDNRVYGSVAASDQSYRTAFTDAIARTSASHPMNPFYLAGGPAPLRYHYFWFILTGLVDRLVGASVSARQAFVASIAWSGISLACLIAAFLKFFAPSDTASPAQRALTGIALLTVTGLDIIPNLILFSQRVFFLDMEWWNEAVTSWYGSLLWVPNHVGGLVAGLTGFLMLWHAARTDGLEKWLAAGLGGIALASMLGCSIYIGFVMAVFLSLWTAISFLAGWRRHSAVLVIAGVVTVALALPYLKSLAGPAYGGSFIHFTVRSFKGATVFHLNTEFQDHWKTGLARLALLPLNYFLELGFFLIVGVLHLMRTWKLRRFTPESIAGITLTLTSVLICTFFKSGVITNNDLGWRGFLPAQFILLIWAVDYIPVAARESLAKEGWLYAGFAKALPVLFLVGVLSTVYSIIGLRFSEVVYDRAPEYETGRRMYDARQVYEQLRGILPVTAVVQQNPDLENPIYSGLYSSRQTAASDIVCGSTFGGSPQACPPVYTSVSALFKADGASAADAERVARTLNINALVVTSGDPVWKAPDSWVWKMQPSIETEYARAYLMTPAQPQAKAGDGE